MAAANADEEGDPPTDGEDRCPIPISKGVAKAKDTIRPYFWTSTSIFSDNKEKASKGDIPTADPPPVVASAVGLPVSGVWRRGFGERAHQYRMCETPISLEVRVGNRLAFAAPLSAVVVTVDEDA